jgi:hypothetical protein
MASQYTRAYIIPQVWRQPVFCCQRIVLATQLPTLELPLNSVDPYRQNHDRKKVEQLAIQHVLEVPANDDCTDTLLRQTSLVIQVQEVPGPGLQTVGQ